MLTVADSRAQPKRLQSYSNPQKIKLGQNLILSLKNHLIKLQMLPLLSLTPMLEPGHNPIPVSHKTQFQTRLGCFDVTAILS